MRKCKKVSIKEITEDCEKKTLYPEENCGQPTTVIDCEDVPEDESRAGGGKRGERKKKAGKK
jgi:hypothetical protein